MEEQRTNQDSKLDPEKEQTKPAKGTETKRRKRQVMLLGGIAVLILTVSGILAPVIHNPLLAIIFMFIGLIVAAFALRLDLINNGSKHRNADLACAAIVVANCILSAWVSCVVLPSKPLPHLRYLVRTDAFSSLTFLTNDFLEITNFGQGPFSTHGLLVMPVPAGRNTMRLDFVLQNRSGITAEETRVFLSIPKSWNPILTEGGWRQAEYDGGMFWSWREGPPKGIAETNEFENLWCQIPVNLAPGDGAFLPPIMVNIPTNDCGWPVYTWYRAKSAPAQGIAFSAKFLNLSVTNPIFFTNSFVVCLDSDFKTSLDQVREMAPAMRSIVRTDITSFQSTNPPQHIRKSK